MSSIYRLFIPVFAIWAAFFVVNTDNTYAQGFTGSGVDMRSLQAHSCREPALALLAELRRIKQDIEMVRRCNERGGFFRNADNSCVDAVVNDHTFDSDAGSSGEAGLSFDGGSTYGLVGGADGQPARCVRVCRYDGVDYREGDELPLYVQSSTCGAACVEQTFTCTDGAFSPAIPEATYADSGSCPAGPCAGCTDPFSGAEIADGRGVMVYNPVRACGDSCTSTTLICEDGSLTSPPWGDGTAEACPDEPTDCGVCLHPVTGEEVAEGEEITLYRENRACGSCSSETFTCTSGSFGSTSGYPYAEESACTTAAACPEGCDVYVGGTYQTTISDGDNIKYYRPSTGEANCGTCDGSTTKSCSDGDDINFSSSYDPDIVNMSACRAANPCPGGCSITWSDLGTTEFVAHGGSVEAYRHGSVAPGATCEDQTRSCNNGVLSGSFTYSSCAPETPETESCELPWGGTIAHGNDVTAYAASSVACGSECNDETRTCNNGTLSGSFTKSTCTVSACASCNLPWGGTIAHGQNTTAYAASSVACSEECNDQTRSCDDGTLSGSFKNETCSPESPTLRYVMTGGSNCQSSSGVNSVSSCATCTPEAADAGYTCYVNAAETGPGDAQCSPTMPWTVVHYICTRTCE